MIFILINESVKNTMAAYIRQLETGGEVAEVEVKTHDPHRTLDQNALINAVYPQIARQKSDESALDVRKRLKLTKGVPILRAENAAFRAFYDSGLKPLEYEQKIEAMAFVPITSIMTKKQGGQYLDAVLDECAEQGIIINRPYRG